MTEKIKALSERVASEKASITIGFALFLAGAAVDRFILPLMKTSFQSEANAAALQELKTTHDRDITQVRSEISHSMGEISSSLKTMQSDLTAVTVWVRMQPGGHAISSGR